MIKLFKKSLFLLFALLCCRPAMAQTINDAGLWATVNVDKKISDKFSLFVTEECRLRENISQLNLFYTDFGVEVRPYKFLKVAVAYRLIEKYVEDNTFSYRHRFMLDVTLKKKFNNLSLSYRGRLQREVRNIYSSETGYLPEWYLRNKFTVKYDIRKFSPYIGTELRYQIKDPRNSETDGLWHRVRYFAGSDYKINNKNTIGLYYLVQHEYNVLSPQNQYIIGIEYSLSL